jgi:flagellar biosynthesis/type III secretory pathway protein FliH
LNPYDSPVVKEHLNEIQAVAQSVRRVEVFEDPTLEGGCRIESDGGAIDATIRGQLELALEHLRGEK